jgi:hypothetical protein
MKPRLLLIGLAVAVALLVVLTLQGLRDSPSDGAAQPPSAPATPAKVRTETPPWQATPSNTTDLPPGTVPAWQVDPPRPDPSTPLPPPPREPPNPALHRPALDNPGGVNGDRPERAVE